MARQHRLGARLGYSVAALADINRQSVAWAAEFRDAFKTERTPIVLNGAIGPRGDGYRADAQMNPTEADDYHRTQIGVFADTDVDIWAAFTLSYADEAIGIVRVAQHGDLTV
jgi:S-methylmethionine-dependent homocysteine/selenocysteine methylase